MFILFKSLFRLVLCAVVASVTASCSGPEGWWEPLPAGTVVLEKPSPNLEFSAAVVAKEEPGSYRLEIQNQRSQERLASRIIAAPVGYHAHLITLEWGHDSRRVIATIDYDFGDNNLAFELVR